MNRHIFLFNPENDMALASGQLAYTPTPAAQLLRRDLQMLPAWFCVPDAEILTKNPEADSLWLAQMRKDWGVCASTIDQNHLFRAQATFHPWGWSLSTRQQFISRGVLPRFLPTDNTIATLRALSGRQTTVLIHKQLTEHLHEQLCQPPQVLTSREEVSEFMKANPKCFLKAPWSSSGRGILSPRSEADTAFALQMMDGYLRTQGAVMGEVAFDKVLDFAMEFHCADGKAQFVGYSVFFNNAHRSYDHGLVAHIETLLSIILRHAPALEPTIHNVRQSLESVLTALVAPHYDGPLGIDMMLFRNADGTIGLNPCVEMNLRCTMGMVACHLAQRLLPPGTVARFSVQYHKGQNDVSSLIAQQCAQSPIVTDSNGKLVSGILPLTPIYPDTQYTATLQPISEPQ